MIKLTIEISRDPEHPKQWTSHCLELDVISAGMTPQTALEAVAEAVRMTIDWVVKSESLSDEDAFEACMKEKT